jgi:hypothetical protein
LPRLQGSSACIFDARFRFHNMTYEAILPEIEYRDFLGNLGYFGSLLGIFTKLQLAALLDLIIWLINFLQIYIYFIFTRIFARFCKFKKLSQKERAKESAKRREPTLTKVRVCFKYWFYNGVKTRRPLRIWNN